MGTHLYRSRDDRMLAGVAGGLADLWDADPSLIRILWALLVIPTGGIALVVYIVMAIVVPEEPDAPYAAGIAGSDGPAQAGAEMAAGTPANASPAGPFTSAASAAPPDWRSQRSAARNQRRAERRARRAGHGDDGRTASIVLGSILLLIGVAFLVREYLPSIDFDSIWPLILVALGVLILLAALRPNGGNGSGPRAQP